MKKRINITMEEWLIDKVDKMAKDRGIDRSSMLSILVYDASAFVDMVSEGETTANITSVGEVY